LTRSSAYDGSSPELQDFQLPYLKYLFTMLGYDVDAVVFEPTTQWEPDQRIKYTRDALAVARAHGAEVSAMTQEPT
jgi:FMN-dependent NADH-azoreductase